MGLWIVEFPPDDGPLIFLSGYATGASVLFFDDGVVCTGAEAGDFDETGFNLETLGKLECTDGTRIKMTTRNVALEPLSLIHI